MLSMTENWLRYSFLGQNNEEIMKIKYIMTCLVAFFGACQLIQAAAPVKNKVLIVRHSMASGSMPNLAQALNTQLKYGDIFIEEAATFNPDEIAGVLYVVTPTTSRLAENIYELITAVEKKYNLMPALMILLAGPNAANVAIPSFLNMKLNSNVFQIKFWGFPRPYFVGENAEQFEKLSAWVNQITGGKAVCIPQSADTLAPAVQPKSVPANLSAPQAMPVQSSTANVHQPAITPARGSGDFSHLSDLELRIRYNALPAFLRKGHPLQEEMRKRNLYFPF